jgi:hypothetical protein
LNTPILPRSFYLTLYKKLLAFRTVRATFLTMLAVSLTIHGLIVGGVALSLRHGDPAQLPPRSEMIPTLTVIIPKPQTVKPSSAPSAAKPVVAQPVTTMAPFVPAPIPPRQDALPMVPAPTAVAKAEANPNAQLPPVAPDAVLAPVSAPRLDGAKGVVFILDVSGSMYEPFAGATRLAYARHDLAGRVRALPDGTPFAVVLYARTACTSGPLVAANAATREAAVRFLMRDVNCDGGTNLPAGLVAARALNTGALVLASDGDLNISGTDLMLQSREILGERGSGPSLLVLGIAPRVGTIDEHLLQDLAELMGGTYLYEPTEQTALLDSKASAAQ